MKWFDLLKNKHGKLTFGLPQMAAIAGVGLVVSLSAFQADKKAAEQEQIRSLSAISSGYNYGGMRQDGRGGLTSINVKDGLNQVATAEERARLEAGRTGDFGLSAADNVGGSVSSSMRGRAAGTSDTDGLGMGRNAVVMQEGAGTGQAVRGARVNPGAVTRGAGREGASGGQQLAPAAVSRSGGSGINASYGGNTTGGNAAAPRGDTGGRQGGEGYKFSGAMPGGTDPLSMRGANGQNATFMAGGRYATTGRGSRTKGTGNDLKDISKRSADAALNRNRSANEGARAFLASAQNSGGMNIDSSVGTTEAGSADFAAAEARNLKALGDWGQQTQEGETKRDKARSTLFTLMIVLVAMTAVAVPLLRYLSTASKTTGLFGMSFLTWARVVFGLVAAMAGTVSVFAIDYWSKYGFGWMSGGALAISVACAGYCLATLLAGKAGNLSKGNDVYKEKLVSSLKGYGTQGAMSLGQFGFNELKNADAKSANTKSGK